MGKKVFKCDIRDCEKLCSSKFSLKRHYLRHLNQKKHICQFCQKGFSLPQYLEEHEYTHTGAKPFICGINGCAETFRQRGKLSIHKKNNHNPDFASGKAHTGQQVTSRLQERLQRLEEEEMKDDHQHSAAFMMRASLAGHNKYQHSERLESNNLDRLGLQHSLSQKMMQAFPQRQQQSQEQPSPLYSTPQNQMQSEIFMHNGGFIPNRDMQQRSPNDDAEYSQLNINEQESFQAIQKSLAYGMSRSQQDSQQNNPSVSLGGFFNQLQQHYESRGAFENKVNDIYDQKPLIKSREPQIGERQVMTFQIPQSQGKTPKTNSDFAYQRQKSMEQEEIQIGGGSQQNQMIMMGKSNSLSKSNNNQLVHNQVNMITLPLMKHLKEPVEDSNDVTQSYDQESYDDEEEEL